MLFIEATYLELDHIIFEIGLRMLIYYNVNHIIRLRKMSRRWDAAYLKQNWSLSG